jgi:hypothetical protein
MLLPMQATLMTEGDFKSCAKDMHAVEQKKKKINIFVIKPDVYFILVPLYNELVY